MFKTSSVSLIISVVVSPIMAAGLLFVCTDWPKLCPSSLHPSWESKYMPWEMGIVLGKSDNEFWPTVLTQVVYLCSIHSNGELSHGSCLIFCCRLFPSCFILWGLTSSLDMFNCTTRGAAAIATKMDLTFFRGLGDLLKVLKLTLLVQCLLQNERWFDSNHK